MIESYAQAATRTAKAAEAESAPSSSTASQAGQCTARGCQLPGTVCASTTGGGEWYCRLHFGTSYAEQPQITALAMNRLPLYRLAFKATNASPGRAVPVELVDAIKRHGRADLLQAPPAIDGRPLTTRTLGAFMLSVLDRECKHAQHDIPDAGEAVKPESWTQMRNLVGGLKNAVA